MPNINSEQVYRLIVGLYLITTESDRRVFEKFSLSIPRYYILYHLAQTPGLSISEVSNLSFSPKTSVSRMVHSMEQEGLVVRRQNKSDRRHYHLYLTDAGEKLFEQTHAAHTTDLKARIDEPVDEIVAVLESLYAQLNNHLKGLGTSSANDEGTSSPG